MSRTFVGAGIKILLLWIKAPLESLFMHKYLIRHWLQADITLVINPLLVPSENGISTRL